MTKEYKNDKYEYSRAVNNFMTVLKEKRVLLQILKPSKPGRG
jgi:hypothetical protein